MGDESRSIFREESLKELSSPERLDQLLRIVRPQTWLTATAILGGMVVVLIWGFLGRIPATATGTAILVHPKQVVSFQSPGTGRISTIEVGVGQVVKRGQVLARLELPTLRKNLEQERSRRELFLSRRNEMSALERELAESEREFIAEQRRLIQDRIAELRAAAELYLEKSMGWLQSQRRTMTDNRALSQELGQSLASWVEAYEALFDDERASKQELIEPQSRLVDNQLRLAELDLKFRELDLREVLAKESYEEKMDLVRDLELRLNDLDLRELVLERRLRESELHSTSEGEEISRRIGELETQLETESLVVSSHDGVVLEVTASVGQHVAMGQGVGKMEIADPDAALMALVYFQVRDGKKVQTGLEVKVSPSTVERERFGSIVGNVTWVSDYPVTTEAAASEIGDLELARKLLGGEARIAVLAHLQLDEDTPTGFRWTSGGGPDGRSITAGTTAQARVTIEEHRPITLVLPFLKSLLGT